MKTVACLVLLAVSWTPRANAQEVDDTINAVADPLATSEIVCDGILTCDPKYEPVCTSNGRTYANACEFKNAYCENPRESFYIVSKGPCNNASATRANGDAGQVFQQQSVEDDDDPVLAMPASVLDVPVELDEPVADLLSVPSDHECDGNVACDTTYDPVCTSNGRTYRNPCEFKNAFCEKANNNFRIVSRGPCSADAAFQVQSIEDEEEGEPPVSEEVLNVPIDVDDVTSPKVNEADELEAPFLEEKSKGDDGGDDLRMPVVEETPTVDATTETPVTDVSSQPPTPADSSLRRPAIDCSKGNLTCDFPDDPVCASNGFTYSHECHFKSAYCEAPSESFYIVSKGPCDSAEVPLQVQSVNDEIWGTVFNVPVELDDDSNLIQPSSVDCDDGNLSCGEKYDPVCGSDGSTFRNECELKNAYCENPKLGLRIVSKGPCSVFVPQAANDGVSADVLNVPVELDEVAVEADVNTDAYRPKPKPTPYCTLVCPTGSVLVAPLCGTDSRSYINDCHLLSAKCEQPDLEKQYDGLCVMGQAPSTRGVSSMGSPALATQEAYRSKCNSFCGRSFAPVCGSNGVTYANQCLFEFAQCQNPRITKLGDGKCAEINSASVSEFQTQSGAGCMPAVCPGTEAPVCGSDGETYLNVCMLNNAQCQIPKLVVAHEGPCGIDTKLTCATRTCPLYSECREDPTTQLTYCADICHQDRCGPNETCKLLTTDCYTAHCPPVATCIPSSNADADVY